MYWCCGIFSVEPGQTLAKPTVPEPLRNPRKHLSLKANLSQRSIRTLDGGQGVFPGQLGGRQSADGAKRGALPVTAYRSADLLAQPGREKGRSLPQSQQSAPHPDRFTLARLALPLIEVEELAYVP